MEIPSDPLRRWSLPMPDELPPDNGISFRYQVIRMGKSPSVAEQSIETRWPNLKCESTVNAFKVGGTRKMLFAILQKMDKNKFKENIKEGYYVPFFEH